MNIKSVNLETVCGLKSQLPENDKIEIAFAGKSNVGKSSLINGLINRKAYARTSGQPGKTQTINFYNVNELLYFVDLPGYGYAKVSKQMRERWGDFIETYLTGSKVLRAVFLLIDIRHEPSENDKLMYDWIKYNGYNPIVIATKLDKISKGQVKKHTNIIKNKLSSGEDIKIIPFSATTKQGRDEIWNVIETFLESEEDVEEHGSEE